MKLDIKVYNKYFASAQQLFESVKGWIKSGEIIPRNSGFNSDYYYWARMGTKILDVKFVEGQEYDTIIVFDNLSYEFNRVKPTSGEFKWS